MIGKLKTMSCIGIIGLQWGDEGKGKIVDLLAETALHIVRPQGGNNAGHTILVGSSEYKFHLIPSGIIYPHTQCYIGGGVVLDPFSFLEELAGLEKAKIAYEGRLWISAYAHLVLPYHRLLDQLTEKAKGKHAVGTTARGIGPCYADKANRTGLRMADLLHAPSFPEKLRRALEEKNRLLSALYEEPPFPFEPLYETLAAARERLAPLVCSVEEKIDKAFQRKERIVFEGAQGALLDTTFGSYPYVTSSSTLAGGLAAGAGFGPGGLREVVGVAKLYTTRVGGGPFPTELSEEERPLFPASQQARELGTTTGRERRLGWLDAFLLRHTARLSGATCLALTKLDILDALDRIKLCVGYKKMASFPATSEELLEAHPIYEEHPGWKTSTRHIRFYEDLPKEAKAYLRRIEELLHLPIAFVSVGPERESTLWLDRFEEEK